MKPLIRCKLDYNKSTHLQQLYAGFIQLRKLGLIDLIVNTNTERIQESNKPVLFATVNDKHTVIYDTLDGFNWISGTIEANLHFFQTTFHADYYFKRSFTRQLTNIAPPGCKLFPLGLNYQIRPEYPLTKPSLVEYLQEVIRKNELASRLLKINTPSLTFADYEHHPIPNKDVKILFLTRLWDPDEFDCDRIRADVETLNKSRIAVIETCRKEFGGIFFGGLTGDQFSRNYAKSLIAPFSFTNKKSYVELVKEHSICIATTGLHHSIGWKFSEYVAASRAIVSEPLAYEVPGTFTKNKNYLEFTNAQELIAGIDFLIQNKLALLEMMQENYHYYNNYLKPENLVLNTLLKVLEDDQM